MIEIRQMARRELAKIRDIDRTEHVTTLYRMDTGRPVPEAVDFQDHGWLDDDGDHSFGHIIDHAERMIDLGGTAFGAFDKNRLAGIAVYRPHLTGILGELALLHVSCADRRQGLASRLLVEAERMARDRGETGLYVSATPSGSAIGFYRHHGFEPTAHPHPDLFALEPEDIHMIKLL